MRTVVVNIPEDVLFDMRMNELDAVTDLQGIGFYISGTVVEMALAAAGE